MEITPRLATTAGGTWVTVHGVPFDLQSPNVELGLRDRAGRDIITWFPACSAHLRCRPLGAGIG